MENVQGRNTHTHKHTHTQTHTHTHTQTHTYKYFLYYRITYYILHNFHLTINKVVYLSLAVCLPTLTHWWCKTRSGNSTKALLIHNEVSCRYYNRTTSNVMNVSAFTYNGEKNSLCH